MEKRKVTTQVRFNSMKFSIVPRMQFLLLILCQPIFLSAQLPEQRDWDALIGAGQNNYEMKMKANEAIEMLDARIAEVMAEISEGLDEMARELLDKSHEEWEEAAKAKCAFLADSYRGGTHEGLAYGYAYIEEQVERIKELFEMKEYRETP
jgi:uncharacterized protein YecT (DUF1311 family)